MEMSGAGCGFEKDAHSFLLQGTLYERGGAPVQYNIPTVDFLGRRKDVWLS
jgi:hypothetical protein